LTLGEKVDWCPSAFHLPPPLPVRVAETSPGLHPHHLAGLYYLQDPSAMAPAELLAPRPGERVLDLAAAPGGKTTHLAALMGGEGLLVANEIKSKRVGHLAQNLERWGAGNVVITNETPEALVDHFGAFFDRVLVDAPCSGEGMFRKDVGARADWSPEMVAGCAVRQSGILRVAAKMVRPGGYLLYSTCTFAPEENEAVIAGLLSRAADGSGMRFRPVALPQLDGFMPGRPDWLDLDGLRRLQSSGTSSGLDRAVRLFPHRVQGEGHFACLLQRVPSSADDQEEDLQPRSDRLPKPSKAQSGFWKDFAGQVLAVDLADDRLRAVGDRLYFVPKGLPDLGRLRVVHPGIWLGALKKDRFEPAHPLALFLRRGQAGATVDLPAGDPRLGAYLRGESFAADGPPGWTLMTVDGFPLGWGKRVQGMVKNHFPRGWIQGQVR
jgi:16S rRNA C967 or C1407 C5-methylase (RsmB/RsmF family)/NOL1/NOP2/fmu family ribosome biogenesis protein